MLVYPFKFLWHDMSSSEEIASKKFSRNECIANYWTQRPNYIHESWCWFTNCASCCFDKYSEITLFETGETKWFWKYMLYSINRPDMVCKVVEKYTSVFLHSIVLHFLFKISQGRVCLAFRFAHFLRADKTKVWCVS